MLFTEAFNGYAQFNGGASVDVVKLVVFKLYHVAAGLGDDAGNSGKFAGSVGQVQ